jgi:uncharacterized RDD family membrane protein YckC
MDKPLASLRQRFTAQLIDGLIAVVVGYLCFLPAEFTAYAYTGKSLPWPMEIWAFGYLSYLVICGALPSGQTLGKRIVNISVVKDDDDKPLTFWQSFVRNIMLFIGIFDIVFIFGKSKRRLGDHLAHTRVVRLA